MYREAQLRRGKDCPPAARLSFLALQGELAGLKRSRQSAVGQVVGWLKGQPEVFKDWLKEVFSARVPSRGV